MMKVIIDARLLLPFETGIGRYIIKLAQTLPTLSDKLQYEFWVQSSLPQDHPIFKIHHQLLYFRRIPIRHMSVNAQLKLVQLVNQFKPDLFHSPHFDLPFGIPGKVIVTLHDLKYISRPEFFTQLGWLKRTVMLLLMKHCARRADRIIAISDFTCREVIRILQADPGKIRTIHQGINATEFQPNPNEAIKKYLRSQDLVTPYILIVSERRPHKNIIGSLLAFQQFMKLVDEDYQLVIAGKPYSDYTEPENLIDKLGLKNSVRLLDYVPDHELPLLYHGAQATLFISHYEGFGLPVLESMAAGTPVVASNSTSIPEVVGEAGLLVNPNDPIEVATALSRVIPKGNLRDQCINRGYERVRLFDLDTTAKKTLEVYQEIIDE